MRLKLICAVLVGVLLIAPGCGSKKKSASTTKATTTAQSTTSTSTSSGTKLTSTDCEKLAAASQTVSSAFTGKVPSDMNAQVARLNAIAKVAPAAIKADFETLANAASQVAKLGLKPNTTPTAKQLKALTSLDVAGISKAAQNIGTWAQKNCATG